MSTHYTGAGCAEIGWVMALAGCDCIGIQPNIPPTIRSGCDLEDHCRKLASSHVRRAVAPTEHMFGNICDRLTWGPFYIFLVADRN